MMRAADAVDRAVRMVTAIMPRRAMAMVTSIRVKPRELPCQALLALLFRLNLFILTSIL
jgi:hypothetical protein